ncbi:MAG: helix-turn-helix domain-containing protein [Opitutales bacterium]
MGATTESGSADRWLGAMERAGGFRATLHWLGAPSPSGLAPAWGSHQRSAACREAFCNRCIRHCRGTVHVRAAGRTRPFLHRCWNGLAEWVVPLHRGDRLVAILFLGQWRAPGARSKIATDTPVPALPDRLSGEAGADWARLIGIGLMQGLDRAVPESAWPDRRTRILRWVRDYLLERPQLAALARHLGLSSSRTSHVVRETCGTSFTRLVNGERLNRAKGLLRETDLPVSLVGQWSGYPDPFTFSRQFRAGTEMSPTAWRQAYGRQAGGADA